MDDIRKVLSVRKYRAGYEIREEVIDASPDITMKSAYNPNGDYLGNSKWGYRLCKKRGIKPEKAVPSDKVCSIGFCEKEQKWYGWSHRAIYGFSVGDIVKEGDCCAEPGTLPEYLTPENDFSLPVGFKAKNLRDAKRMAIAFADSVG